MISSLRSLPPPKIVLNLVELRLVWEVDSQAWGLIGERLCLLAEQFKVLHPGSKMEVKFSVGYWDRRFIPVLVELFKTVGAMVKLKEDANVVIAE